MFLKLLFQDEETMHIQRPDQRPIMVSDHPLSLLRIFHHFPAGLNDGRRCIFPLSSPQVELSTVSALPLPLSMVCDGQWAGRGAASRLNVRSGGAEIFLHTRDTEDPCTLHTDAYNVQALWVPKRTFQDYFYKPNIPQK